MVVIGAMLATALAVGNPLAAVGRGAVRRLRLDDRLGPVRRRSCRTPSVLIMVTYHLGQAGLVASLLR